MQCKYNENSLLNHPKFIALRFKNISLCVATDKLKLSTNFNDCCDFIKKKNKKLRVNEFHVNECKNTLKS